MDKQDKNIDNPEKDNPLEGNIPKQEEKPRKKLGELLIDQGIIEEKELKEALIEQKITRQRLGEILVELGYATEEQINRVVALQFDTQVVRISDYLITPQVLALVKEADAMKFKVMPLFKSENNFYIAMKNPNDIFSIDHLQKQTGLKIIPFLASEENILWAIEQYYESSGSVEEILTSIDQERLVRGEADQEAAIVKMINLLISKAVHDKASDIHLEPEENVLNVRYRIDGVLYKRHVLPKALQSAIISRVKILSNLDISEKRMPQDGRLRMRVEGREIDFRVSICPGVFGENTVLRILDKAGLILGLEFLGFSPEEYKQVKEMLSLSYGIILVTGPTGSGKTTTLYSSLQLLNKEEVNIMTVEDPVEYEFPRLRQFQINPKIGFTFANVLRSFLRQDPNIIMVGEIRDLETAEIAVQAALTGHLVFSTLHTNDSPTAFSRLIEMGVEPFLVSSSLIGVLAQRLVRKVCLKCKQEYTPTEEIIKVLGLEGRVEPNVKFVRGKGCNVCNWTGYKGRLGIYELLRNSSAVQALIINKSSADEIRKVAVGEGMKTLREAALEKLLKNLTTPEEVFRVTQNVSL